MNIPLFRNIQQTLRNAPTCIVDMQRFHHNEKYCIAGLAIRLAHPEAVFSGDIGESIILHEEKMDTRYIAQKILDLVDYKLFFLSYWHQDWVKNYCSNVGLVNANLVVADYIEVFINQHLEKENNKENKKEELQTV